MFSCLDFLHLSHNLLQRLYYTLQKLKTNKQKMHPLNPGIGSGGHLHVLCGGRGWVNFPGGQPNLWQIPWVLSNMMDTGLMIGVVTHKKKYLHMSDIEKLMSCNEYL